ncbi:MAG: thiol peroxidase [Flavobacteriales bacterium]|nr:thiol peroxidase [Flavobacteriales bacterium]
MPQPAFFGPLPAVGTTAPTLRYVKADRKEAALHEHSGHVVILIAFPSVDTSTCALETRTFNQKASGMGAKVVSISMDLPFALNRFCAAEGIANVEAGSDFRYHDAAHVWGAALTEGALAGTLGRITWVIDKEGVIRYQEVTPELGAEPDYEAALNAAKALL